MKRASIFDFIYKFYFGILDICVTFTCPVHLFSDIYANVFDCIVAFPQIFTILPLNLKCGYRRISGSGFESAAHGLIFYFEWRWGKIYTKSTKLFTYSSLSLFSPWRIQVLNFTSQRLAIDFELLWLRWEKSTFSY